MNQNTCPITGEPLKDNNTISPTAAENIRKIADRLKWLNTQLTIQKTSGATHTGNNTSHVAPCPTTPLRLDVTIAALPHENALHEAAKLLGAPSRNWYTTTLTLYTMPQRTTHKNAPQAAQLTINAYKALTRIIDTPPQHHFIGRCLTLTQDGENCDTPLYTPNTTTTTTCPTCHTQWDNNNLLTQHLQAAANYEMTPRESVQLLSLMGVNIKVGTLQKWVQRGKLNRTQTGYTIHQLLTAANLQ